MVETFTEGQPAPADTAAPAAPQPAPEATPTPAPTAAPEKTPYESVRAAAQALARRRQEKRAEAAAPEAAPAPDQSSPQASEAAQEAGPGETQEADPVVELPPIEPPRSWKKEDKAAFAALPREVQERVSESERARETEFLRRQNEVSEKQKAFDAELSQMQATRQQYEQGLQSSLQMMLSGNEFADIKSMEDLEALANNDWPRWVRYQTHQQKVGMLQQQLKEVQDANYQEQVQQWSKFASEEDTRFNEKFPDAAQMKDAAISYLTDAGFSNDEIGRYWNSAAWRDHRMQGIILDAVRFRQAKAKAADAVKKPAPSVQKPGIGGPKANPFQAQITELEAKGGLTLREATKLNSLRRLAKT